MLDQRRGEDVAEKRNPKHSSVNKLINNWHEYAKYYRTLILTRCSSLTRLIKNDQHGKRKHKRPKQHNLFPLLPFLCQCSVSLWPLGMMHPPLPVGCQRLGKVITGKQVINQGREKTQTYTDLLGNFVLTRRFMWKETEKENYLCAQSFAKSQTQNQIFTPFWLIQIRKNKIKPPQSRKPSDLSSVQQIISVSSTFRFFKVFQQYNKSNKWFIPSNYFD